MVEALHATAYTALALALLLPGGNWLCGRLLRATGLQAAMERRRTRADGAATTPAAIPGAASAPPPREPRVGALIGHLERALLAFGVLIGAWEILAAIIALKTVARFKELDEKLDAEYFLVGSLFSLAWGVLVTAAWVAYDKQFGLDLSGRITALARSLRG